MEALQGYGSGTSDSDDEQPATLPQQQNQPQTSQMPQQTARPPPTHCGIQLPSAAELFGTGPSSSSVRTAAGGVQKRSQSHGQRLVQAGPLKAARAGIGSRPSRPASGALVPPQLRGRSNIVTEDLDRLFSKKTKPRPTDVSSPG